MTVTYTINAHARAPGVAPIVNGQAGYETVWLNNDHAFAAIYYPPAVIYPSNAYQSAPTIYPIFILSSKEIYYDFPLLFDTDFTYVKWEFWVKWDNRDMNSNDLSNINMPGAELGPEGQVKLQYTLSLSGGPVTGSITLSTGEGPDTEFDNTQVLGTPDDPLDYCCPVSGTWMKLGWAKVQWTVTWTSVKQKGFYLFAFANDYMVDYLGENVRLLSFNRVDMNWIMYYWVPPFAPIPIGSYTVSYRFIIGDDEPRATDTNWFVVSGSYTATFPQPD